MKTTGVPARRRVGALITFYDLPAVQIWVAAAALGLGYSLQSVGVAGARWVLALVAMGLLFMYLMAINDLYDIEIDSMKHEHSGLVTGAITKREAEVAVAVSGFLGLAGSFLVSYWFFAFAVIIFLLSTLYSAPPVRFKKFYPYSTLGELAGGYFLFLLGFSIFSVPTPESYVATLVPALIAASMRLGHEAKYAEFDRATGKRTMAVVHGAKSVQRVVTVLPYAAVALAAALFALGVFSLILTALSLAFIILPTLIRKTIRAKGSLRPVSFVWGFLFFFLTIATL